MTLDDLEYQLCPLSSANVMFSELIAWEFVQTDFQYQQQKMSLTNTRFVGYYGILWDFLETRSFTSVWYLKAEIDQPTMHTAFASCYQCIFYS